MFNLHSPRIVNIEVIKHGDVRRAKLYYLRGTSGKKAKVQEKIGAKKGKDDKSNLSASKKDLAAVKSVPDHLVEIDEELTEEPVEAAQQD